MQKLTTVSILLLVVLGGASIAYVAAQPLLRATTPSHSSPSSSTSSVSQTSTLAQGQVLAQAGQHQGNGSLLTNGPSSGSTTAHHGDDGGSGGSEGSDD